MAVMLGATAVNGAAIWVIGIVNPISLSSGFAKDDLAITRWELKNCRDSQVSRGGRISVLILKWFWSLRCRAITASQLRMIRLAGPAVPEDSSRSALVFRLVI
jgi:hypothetical protein